MTIKIKGLVRGSLEIRETVDNWISLILNKELNKMPLMVKCKNGTNFILTKDDFYYLHHIAGLCGYAGNVNIEILEDTVKISNKIYPRKYLKDIIASLYYLYKLKATLSKVEPPMVEFKWKNRILKFILPSISDSRASLTLKEIFYDQEYYTNVKDKTVLDIGGYIGETAIYFSTLGAKHVYVFEPSPRLYELAKQNIEINRISNIRIYNKAIGSTNGTLELLVDEGGFGVESKFLDKETHKKVVDRLSKKVTVPVVDIREFLKSVGDIDIVKIDCEGCEYEVLPILLHYKPEFNEIIVEIHKVKERKPHALLELIKSSKGYSYTILHTSGKHLITVRIAKKR